MDAQRRLVALHVNLADEWTALDEVNLFLGSFLRTILHGRRTQSNNLLALCCHSVVTIVLDDLDTSLGLRQLSRAVDARPAGRLRIEHGIKLELVLVEVLEVLSDRCVLLLNQL